jgi:hypothetical protein
MRGTKLIYEEAEPNIIVYFASNHSEYEKVFLDINIGGYENKRVPVRSRIDICKFVLKSDSDDFTVKVFDRKGNEIVKQHIPILHIHEETQYFYVTIKAAKRDISSGYQDTEISVESNNKGFFFL